MRHESDGEPVELSAYGKLRDQQRPATIRQFSRLFRYANGAYAVVSQTLAAFEHHQTVKATGSKGAVWASWSGAIDRTLDPSFFLRIFNGENLEEFQFDKKAESSLSCARRSRVACTSCAAKRQQRRGVAIDCGPPSCAFWQRNRSGRGGRCRSARC